MSTPAEVQQFIAHWEKVELNERAVAQSHFNALCHLLGLKGPVEADPKGKFFRFEKPLTKAGGAAGYADVWYRDRFAVEYKTKGKYPTLRDAYLQLLLYKDDLDNPPVLVACDIANYEVHVAFTGYPSRVYNFTNRDLENQQFRDLLRKAFTAPEELRPVEQADTITRTVAERFAKVAQMLQDRKYAPTEIAHFFMKLLFALFAEDIKLLPAELMSKSIKQAVMNPLEFPDRARDLFRKMREGGYFGMDRVPKFNGWLFNDDEVIALNADELTFLADAARYDWAAVEPAIFGTLFERSLDPSKRAQLGAHYTSRDDILLIVRPVLMDPLLREWEALKAEVETLQTQWEATEGNARKSLQRRAEGKLLDFVERLKGIKVLDPACGSGNFLYVALTELKNLEKAVWSYAGGLGLDQPDLGVSPAQLYGIEKSPFAAELAQVVVWIGYLQWMRTNGFLEGWPKEPVLQTLHTIENRDAILAVDLNGQPAEPEWPEADVIVGNPPFLGIRKMREELGNTYVEALRHLYADRLPPSIDLVCYWFEKARALIEVGITTKAGLLATSSIRGGSNRTVLRRIKETGDIFFAYSTRPWVLEGATLSVSMIGFDKGLEVKKYLDGKPALFIDASLSTTNDATQIKRLVENFHISYQGTAQVGPFEIDEAAARAMLASHDNTSSRLNSDVIKPSLNGLDIVQRPRNMWTIDFGTDMTLDEAALYKQPFEYVKTNVKPMRDSVRRKNHRERWWLFAEARPGMRRAINPLRRYIATPWIARHRVFVWVSTKVIPSLVVVIAREDNYFLGVLQAQPHLLWSLRMGTSLDDRPRYTTSTCFQTYPFPWAPGTEPSEDADPKVKAIADAARELVRLRDEWLNPSEGGPSTG